MGLMDAVGRGLSAAGYAAADLFGKQALDEQRAKLEEEKALRIDEVRRGRDRAAAVTQGNEINSAVQQAQNERDAAAINAANGSTMSAEDAQVLRDNPEARKAYGLMDQTRKSDLEDRANAAERLGYLDAARETRGALQTEIANQRNESLDKNAERRADAAEAHAAAMEKYQMRREDRMDRLAELQIKHQDAMEGKYDARAEQADKREARAATAKALDGANADIKALERDLANPMLAEEQSKVIRQQLLSARTEAARYRTALAGAGLKGSKVTSPDKPFNPNDFKLKTNTEAAPAATAAATSAVSAPSVAKPATSDANKPTYEKWLAAKERLQEVQDIAAKMSPDRREAYLENRLPALREAVEFNSKYATY